MVFRRALSMVVATVALATGGISHARPFVPDSDSAVLERLPEATDPSLAVLKPLRAAVARSPQDLDVVAAFARQAIGASRHTGDPRFLGYAQAALSPWWASADVPPAALLLRATIKQSRHQFPSALEDLDRLLAARPGDGQALLTRASILTVVGRHAEAERDCMRLARRAPDLIVVTCRAGAQSLAGGAQPAYRELMQALERDMRSDPGVRAWALTLAAEIAARQGERDRADAHFRAALAMDPRDAYARGAYADFLIDSERPREAAALLAQDTKNDTLMLRLVLAEARIPDAAQDFARHRADLAARYDAARRRGDATHARDEARFRLIIEGDARAAVELARANFDVNREPADLRVLVDAARAADDKAALATATDWIATTRLEDVTIATRAAGKQ
jgi:tetratricopeptide (TPR) repeat protein